MPDLIERLRGIKHGVYEGDGVMHLTHPQVARRLEEGASALEAMRDALEQTEQQLDYGQTDTAHDIIRAALSKLDGKEAP